MWGRIVTRTFLHCLLGAVCRACRGFEAANTHFEVLLNGILGVYIEVIYSHNGKEMETTVVMGYMIYPKPYSIYLRGTIAFDVFSGANLTQNHWACKGLWAALPQQRACHSGRFPRQTPSRQASDEELRSSDSEEPLLNTLAPFQMPEVYKAPSTRSHAQHDPETTFIPR